MTDTNDVAEKIECDQCERELPRDRVKHIEIDEYHHLCERCIEGIEHNIENYYWYDRYTKDHHERAVEILEEQDEIRCVHDWYEGGEIIVHTDYVSSNVVSDVAERFGLEIVTFGPQWQEDNEEWKEHDGGWDCIIEDGSAFEILLEYNSNSPPPLPLEANFEPIDLNFLEETDKQFGDDA